LSTISLVHASHLHRLLFDNFGIF